MRIKPGVKLDGLSYMLVWAAAVIDFIHQARGYGEATITSGLDGGDAYGPARVAGTLHPRGLPLDFRIWEIPAQLRQAFAQEVQRNLGNAFQVILEEDHLHVELQMTGFRAA